MLTTIHTSAVNGMAAMPVFLEVNANEIHSQEDRTIFFMVGLPDNAVRESKLRVESALQNSGFQLPLREKYTINFAPADVRKEGSGYDLPLAIGMLASLGRLPSDKLGRYVFVGELGLDGSVRPVKGALSIAIKAREQGFEALFVPKENEREAAVVNKLKVYGVESLLQVVAFLQGKLSLQPTIVNTREEFYAAQATMGDDFADVKGQDAVKRAFEVAAAGGHNIILIGAPGCGKSMMAKRVPSILPQLTLSESLETTQIHSIAGKLGVTTSLIARRPFRAPHHTISDVALIGGGTTYKPGEISLAHNGVLFLDELPEFSRSALETLRQPLEDRMVSITRAKYSVTLPCSFMLVASMNPCPCGYYNHPTHKCVCSPGQIQRYMSRISGPLLDRMDIQVEVTPVPFDDLANSPRGESSATIRNRVIKAREVQMKRFGTTKHIHCNAQMSNNMIHAFAEPDDEGKSLLAMAMKRFDLSARAYERILKVARTIADLDGSPDVRGPHIAEAIGYRNLDRSTWGE